MFPSRTVYPLLCGLPLDCLDQLTEKGVYDIRDNQPKSLGLVLARQAVGAVVRLLHNLQYASACFRADSLFNSVYDSGNRRF